MIESLYGVLPILHNAESHALHLQQSKMPFDVLTQVSGHIS